MQTDVERKIVALALRRELLSESEVSHLMTLCRKFLEHLTPDERATFPIVKFFSNWALHIALDRDHEGMAVLKRLNDTLREVAAIPDNDLIAKRVTEVVSFGQLRRELGALFAHAGAHRGLNTDQEQWTNFAKHLIEIIRDCPLVFGETMSREARALHDAAAANPIKKGRWVVGLAVILGRQLSNIYAEGQLCICIQMSDTTRIVVPMAAPEVFGPPN